MVIKRLIKDNIIERSSLIKHLFLILLISVYISVFIIINNAKVLFVDETLHFDQIIRFAKGDFSINPNLIMFPGYHIFFSPVVKMFGTTSYYFLRFVSFTLNIFLVYLFYKTAIKLDRKTAFSKTFLFSFLPILFPYLFFLYTDGFSTTLIILSLYLILNKKYTLSGFIGSYSLFVRQNNLFFIIYFCFLIYYKTNRFKLSYARIKKYLKTTWIWWVGLILFGSLIIGGGGLVTNSYIRSYVRFSLSSFANIFFCLFVLFFLFLPIHLQNFPKIWRLLKRIDVILIILSGFGLFWISFIPDHPFNQATWFLHNAIFQYFSADDPRKVIFYFISVYCGLSLSVTKLIRKEYYLLYPVTLLYLLPHWLVEIRYYIVPAALFILFQKDFKRTVFMINTLSFIGMSLYLIWGIINANFFP